MDMSLRRKSGFTLLELLVVIAIIGILAGMLFPAIQNALLKGKALKAGNSMGSKGVQGQIYADSLENDSHGMPQLYPRSVDSWGTSTAFFDDLLKNPTQRIENIDFTYFALPGSGAIPAVGSVSNATFAAANNGWCITLDLDTESNPNIPFIFTKNIKFSGTKINTIDATAPIDNTIDVLGKKMAIVIYAQGAVKIFEKAKFLTADEFNPSGADNDFIIP